MITEEQKARIRYHLGYHNVSAASTFQLGIPAGTRTSFMIEGAWDELLPASENNVLRYLCEADKVIQHLFGSLDLVDVSKTQTVEVNPKRLRELSLVYNLAIETLANEYGVLPNPFDQRTWVQMGRGGINVGVSG